MPQKAWNAKRERQYKHMKSNESARGRSVRVAERFAAATVNRTRAAKSETKSAARAKEH